MNRHIKRIITACFLVGVLFMIAPATSNAQTNSSQWARQTGGADIKITEQGVSLECKSGLNVWEYTKETVDITDFSVTFSVGQEAWYGGSENGMYQTIILKNKQEWGGSYGLFLLLMPSESGSLRVEGQILNKGYLLSPSYTTFDVDVTKPITLRGTLEDDSHYKITVDGDDANAYVFEIPINYQFQTELNGQGWFCFGVCSTKEDKVEMKVESVNGLDLTGTDSGAGATDSSDDSGDAEDEILKPDGTVGSSSELMVNSGNSQKNSFSGNMDESLYLTLIVCLCVMEIIIVGGVVFFFAYVRKKVKKINSMVESDDACGK